MNKQINSIVQRYADDEIRLSKLIVSAFARFYNIKITSSYLSKFNTGIDNDLEEDIDALSQEFSLESVISIFELAIPRSERTANGAVYTPKFIRDYIVTTLIEEEEEEKPLQNCLCADISCGCGAFLFTLMELIHNRTRLPYKNILHNLYGVDISPISIGRAKILLALTAQLNHESIEDEDFRLYCGDSLCYDFSSLTEVRDNQGFDLIVGNPPYVRSKHIDPETKRNLTRWSTSKVGNSDLYIPFFEIGLSILNENGLLGYITVNSFFKSVNARLLRNYLSHNNISLKIIDFGQKLVFKKKLAYTCITLISKTSSKFLHYVMADIEDIKTSRKLEFNPISYNSLDNQRGWHLNSNEVLANIYRIETAGESLGEKYVIKNGIATLANKIFIFRPIREDNTFYYFRKDRSEVMIEKGICRDIIKPNIIKNERDISTKQEKIIFPYDCNYNPINEEYFKDNFQHAYNYLLSYRDILEARDKGKGNYGDWYVFGRTQAISDRGLKLLFPYISDAPHFIYTDNKDMLIYCGYAIFHESERELLFLKRVLESKIFEYYIRNTSKPYSTGYYSYAKNYVKNFGLYPFSESQKEHILSMDSEAEIDKYLSELYKVTI